MPVSSCISKIVLPQELTSITKVPSRYVQNDLISRIADMVVPGITSIEAALDSIPVPFPTIEEKDIAERDALGLTGLEDASHDISVPFPSMETDSDIVEGDELGFLIPPDESFFPVGLTTAAGAFIAAAFPSLV